MAIRYLLDTNVVSQFEKRRPNAPLMEWMETVEAEELGVPLNVLTEIQRGIMRVRRTDPGRADGIKRWFAGYLDSAETNLVAPNPASVLILAAMAETPALREFFEGRPNAKVQLGDDPQIAALAISLGVAIVTFDTDDFLRIHEHFRLPGLFHPGRHVWLLGDPPRRERRNPETAVDYANAPALPWSDKFDGTAKTKSV